MAQYLKHVLCLLLTLAAIHSSRAAYYAVTNNAGASTGGVRFDNEVGIDYCKQILSTSAEFIHKLFQHGSDDAARKDVPKVSMVVESIDGVAYASDDEIHVSANYIERFPGDVKNETTGLLYHEMAHILQWNGNNQAPSGLTEGIADYVRLKAGYAPDIWVPPGRGDYWNQGYDVTARFLDYCDSIKNGFVAELNKKMKNSYSDDYFSDLLGKPVKELWSDYKAMYGE